MRKTFLVLAAALVASPAIAQTSPAGTGFDVAAAKARIDAALAKAYPELDAFYKDIHSHPELGFQETRTAALLASKMRELGFTVTEHVGKTGIVAIYKNGPGPVVLVRTELDALPVEEKTGLPYASASQQTLNGKLIHVAHACGHDIHMAWWVGAAEALLAVKDRWHGTLMFIGQPAEETGGGAKAMVEDGLFTRWQKPDYGFAAHVSPMPAGTIFIKDGIVTAASDGLELTFHGIGAHGSMPDKGIDPIVEAAHFVTDVQTVISREMDPNLFGVVTVGSFVGGTVGNIIPDHADLLLTLRSHDEDTRKLLIDGVERTARAVAEMARAPAPTIIRQASIDAVRNDAALSARATVVMKLAFDKEAVFVPATDPGINASEDFSAFINAGIPSVFFGVGGTDPATIARYRAEGKPLPVNHSPFFAPVPEPSIKRGAETLALAVMMVAGIGAATK